MFFLFIVLEGSAFALLVRDHYIQRISMAKATGTVSGVLYEWVSGWRNYVNLYEINQQLLSENNMLRNRLPESLYVSDALYHVDSVASDTLTIRKYRYVQAEVVNNMVNKQYNFITVNKGAQQNIAENMAVIGPDGVVGIVYGVSDHFSTVLPVINRNFRLSAKFKRSDLYGSLTWDGRSYRYASLDEIPLHVPVEIGDTLVVSGYSSSFPEGIPIGMVNSFNKKDGNFYTIEVLLFTDFRKLFHVSIIENKMKGEQDTLENKMLNLQILNE
jgi:rod shape-determining protein MreC